MDLCIEAHRKIKRKSHCAWKYLYIIVYKYNMIKVIQAAVFSTKKVLVHMFNFMKQEHPTSTSKITINNNNN